MIPALSTSGFLPLGRYATTVDEIKDRYVEQISSDRRREIWDDFETVRKLISSIIPICSIWISGSFLSDKVEPSDIDLLFIFKESDVTACKSNPSFDSMLRDLGSNQLRVKGGLKVDTRWILWMPNITTGFSSGTVLETIYAKRGFWDEFWSRRYKIKGESHTEDANLKQGYLEVIVNGFIV